MRKPLLMLTLALALPLTAQTPAKPADLSIAKIEHDVPVWMEATGIPGLSIALIRHGKTKWLGTFGLADVAADRPVEVDSAFNVASLSKPLFAYIVLKLVDEGKLDLDTPLTHYWPERITDDPRLDKITARLILTHRSGLPNFRSGKGLRIYFDPGTRFSYSTEGFVYLQHVVEHIEGQPLNDIAQRLVFTPLDMTESSYTWMPQWSAHATVGYQPDGTGRPLFHRDTASAGGSLNTTPRDYAKFVEAVLAGRGLKAATLRAMETPAIALDPACITCTDKVPTNLSTTVFWGLGWAIETTPAGKYLFHLGDNGVYKALVFVDIKHKFAIIMMANSEYGLSIANDIVQDTFGPASHPGLDQMRYDTWHFPNLQFTRALFKGNVAGVLAQFNAQLTNGTIDEGTLNTDGYYLFRGNRIADAIAVFKRNTELHPISSNAFDSLGEAYMTAGNNDVAMKSYQKSFELDPTNDNARERLAQLNVKLTEPAKP